MNARLMFVALAFGTTLAVGTPVADAHVARIAPDTVVNSSSRTAAAERTARLRWEAIDAFLKAEKLKTTHSTQPKPDPMSLIKGQRPLT
jgi:hypothetical protein